MDDIQSVYASIIVLAGVIGLIGSAIGSITTIKTFLKKAVNQAVEDEVEDKIDEAKTDINTDLEISLTVMQESIDNVSEQIRELDKSVDSIKTIQKDTTQSNARYVINEAHKIYIKQGWIDYYTLSALEDIFETYSETGGNHFTADHMQDLRDLPNEKPVKPKTQAKPKTKAKR